MGERTHQIQVVEPMLAQIPTHRYPHWLPLLLIAVLPEEIAVQERARMSCTCLHLIEVVYLFQPLWRVNLKMTASFVCMLAFSILLYTTPTFIIVLGDIKLMQNLAGFPEVRR